MQFALGTSSWATKALAVAAALVNYAPTDGLPFPGLPVTFAPSTASYWSAHNRGANTNRLLGYGSQDPIPYHVDVAIVGAGISGAAVAHFLLNGKLSNTSVALFEAREISSGATGRNGGFVKPVPFRAYSDYKDAYGIQEALQLVQSEYDNLDLTRELVDSGKIDADFVIRPHKEIILDEGSASLQKSQLDLIRADRASLGVKQSDGVTWIGNSTEARLETRSRAAVAAYVFDTGSMWPHKFVHGLISNLLPLRRFRLFTRTPVTHIFQLGNSSIWYIQTPRGNMTCKNLILTTNGYTATLLPNLFTTAIFPKRTQMAAYTPPQSFGPLLDFTFGLRGFAADRNRSVGEGEEAYGLTTSDGTLVVGSDQAAAASEIDGVQWVGSTDDTVVFNRTTEYYRQFPRRVFQGWGQEAVGEGLYRTWTGIQGHTPDSLPFVGAVPGIDGLYVSAGFHGHGMTRCLIASRGVVYQLESPNHEWDRRLPTTFKITRERLNVTSVSL